MKSDSTQYLNQVQSKSGDLFQMLAHHGPAIENEWMALRLYFDHKAAIDIYSKVKPGLELKKALWYPTPLEQKNGMGADYYKAGNTVGCGGIRLWDGEKVVPLNPVSNRSSRVVKEGNTSYMEMLSEGIPYKNKRVAVLVRVTVFSGIRKAKVEAFALTDEPVQFVTGINYHKGQTILQKENYILVWGLHPEDVATQKVAVGAAILFNPENYVKKMDDGKQHLLISKLAKQTEHWITSACALETELNNMKKFKHYVEK